MKMATCPKCGRAAWHRTTAAVIDRKANYEEIIGEDGKREKIRIADTVRVLKPSQVRKAYCKRHSPKTATTEKTKNWKSAGPRHKNRKSLNKRANA